MLNSQRRSHASLIGGLILLFLIGSGCASAVETIAPTTSLTNPGPTRTSSAIPVLTATPLFTWTPLPTLSNTHAEEQLLNWLQGAPDCLLPCWAGITPQVTTWQEAKQILAAVLDFRSVTEDGTCVADSCNLIEWRTRGDLQLHGFITSQSDGLINRIRFGGELPTPLYRIDRILDLYGPPERLLLDTRVTADNGPMILLLAYPNYQFIIEYVWRTTLTGGYINGRVVGCIQQGLMGLHINSMRPPWTDEMIRNEMFPIEGYTNLRPLSEVTDVTISEFYEEFRSIDGSECISTPIQSWLPQQ